MEQCDLDTLAVSLARLEARVEAIREMQSEANRTRDRSLEALNGANTSALALAREELTRRLDILNGEQSRIATLTAETMPREVFEAKHASLAKEVHLLSSEFKELRGRLWLPMLAAGSVSGALAVGLMKLLM